MSHTHIYIYIHTCAVRPEAPRKAAAPSPRECSGLYYTILYYTIPYHTIPYHTIPDHTIIYYTIVYYNVLYDNSHIRSRMGDGHLEDSTIPDIHTA